MEKITHDYFQNIAWDNIPGEFYWKDKSGCYLGCSQSLINEFGLNSLKDIIGKTDYDLWPEQADELRKNDKRAMEMGKTIYVEEMVEHNSNKKYFIGIKMPFLDAQGDIVGIIGNSIPISEETSQFILKEEKEKAEKEIKITVQYLKSVIDSIPGSVYLKDKQGVYLECNDFMVKTAGLSSIQDIIGKDDYELWPAQADSLKENDRKVMESGNVSRLEEDVVLPSGEKRFFAVVKMPLRDENNSIVGIIGNSLDITELKKNPRSPPPC